MPKVSVLMPVYKTPEKYLREAIESILNQSFDDFELLQMLCSLCHQHSSMRYLLESIHLTELSLMRKYLTDLRLLAFQKRPHK